MKTAISVPDALYERVERLLASTGQSRSAFFADAARRHLETLEQDEVTARIDVVAGEVRDSILVEFNRDRLGNADDQW